VQAGPIADEQVRASLDVIRLGTDPLVVDVRTANTLPQQADELFLPDVRTFPCNLFDHREHADAASIDVERSA